MTKVDVLNKRIFDVVVSFFGLILFGWIIFLAYIGATISTKSNGLFVQKRVGKDGKIFQVFKLKTMKYNQHIKTTVTTVEDKRITTFGKLLRKSKIDELPQLINVLIGDMSIVGPRPDVAGFADKLEGDDRIILTIRPGITGPATIKYKYEEKILAKQDNPELYNKKMIYPDKIEINRKYILDYSFKNDLRYIYQTLIG